MYAARGWFSTWKSSLGSGVEWNTNFASCRIAFWCLDIWSQSEESTQVSFITHSKFSPRRKLSKQLVLNHLISGVSAHLDSHTRTHNKVICELSMEQAAQTKNVERFFSCPWSCMGGRNESFRNSGGSGYKRRFENTNRKVLVLFFCRTSQMRGKPTCIHQHQARVAALPSVCVNRSLRRRLAFSSPCTSALGFSPHTQITGACFISLRVSLCEVLFCS